MMGDTFFCWGLDWELLLHLLETQLCLEVGVGVLFWVLFLSDEAIFRCEKYGNPTTCSSEAPSLVDKIDSELVWEPLVVVVATCSWGVGGLFLW